MLKYNDLISRLTDGQKVRILTGVGDLSGKDLKILGIPRVKIGNIKDYGRDLYPHATALAHSWDTALWEQVAYEKTVMMLDDKVKVAIAPGAKIKLSPYRRENTEDPYLAEEMSAAYLRGVGRLGVIKVSAGLYVTEGDIDFMDEEPNERVINDFLIAPYLNARRKGKAEGIVTDSRIPNAKYADVSSYIQERVIGNCEFLICKKATEENTVDMVSRGIICIEGSANALEGALTRYKKLMMGIERNEGASEEQLKKDIEEGTAISEDTVNASLDIVLEFLYRAAVVEAVEEELRPKNEDVAFLSTMKSTVLLKNTNRILPLAGGNKYAIVGDIAYGEGDENSVGARVMRGLERRGYKCTGIARGYDSDDYFSDLSVTRAVELAEKSDTVLLFLGFGYDKEKRIPKTEKLTLPANQLRLAKKIADTGKQVIAIIASGHAPDIEFTRDFDAVLLSPLGVKHSADALVRILSGEYNPSGKLAYTLYSGSEHAFMKRKVYRRIYGMKSGPFVGYRYYDTADMRVGYPFGHGLSYTYFDYSHLSVAADGTVRFTVKNVGDLPGSECAQVYIGKIGSKIIRPKKELVGFARIELLPGESKTVELKPEIPTVFLDGKSITEQGEYTVCVGSSVSDIRLSIKGCSEGVIPEEDTERLCDYLQSESNIIDDNYTLEAKYGFMKRSIKNILFGIGSVALAISVAVFNSISESPSVFLGAVSGILAITAIMFFILEAVERSKLYKLERSKIDEANAEYFEDAEQLSVLSTDRMFKDEFDTAEEEGEVEVAKEHIADDGHMEFIDTTFRIADAAGEFEKFAKERGFKLSAGCSESLMAALATSKLVLTDMPAEDFNSFIMLLSEYFSTDAFVDSELTKIADGHGFFFTTDEHGDFVKRNVTLAVEAAKTHPESVTFAALNNATVSGFAEYIAPFGRYIASGKPINEIRLMNEHGTNVGYSMPNNLWFIINLDENTALDTLPLASARLASVLNIDYVKCPVAESVTISHGFSRYQIEYILEKESKKEIPEEIFKKVDRLEKYAGEHSEFRIGNKMWLGFERFISLLICCGMEVADAVDAGVAIKLLPSICGAVKGNLTGDDKSVMEMVEFIFGDENIAYAKALNEKINATNSRLAQAETQKKAKSATEEERRTSGATNADESGELGEEVKLDLEEVPLTLEEVDVRLETEEKSEKRGLKLRRGKSKKAEKEVAEPAPVDKGTDVETEGEKENTEKAADTVSLENEESEAPADSEDTTTETYEDSPENTDAPADQEVPDTETAGNAE